MIDTYKLRTVRMTEKDYRDELLETLESFLSLFRFVLSLQGNGAHHLIASYEFV